MDDFLVLIVFRAIVRTIGKYVRFAFFNLIGKRKSLKSLSNRTKNEYSDLGKAIQQDFYNAIVGSIILSLIFLIFLLIILR
jgi:hypothetical protein